MLLLTDRTGAPRSPQANTPIDLATKSFAFLKPYAGGVKG